MSLTVTFLGTGTSQGVPMIGCSCPVCLSGNPKDKRLRTSVLIEYEGKVIVIDTGPDFRQQMLREKVKSLDGVVFTHEHKDHIAGLDDVRAFNYITKKHIDVFANKNVMEALKREYKYIFEVTGYPGIPRLDVHEITNKPFLVQGIEFMPVQVKHFMLPVFGYRVGDFTYITDACSISKKEKEKVKGSKVVVVNALRRAKHISHFTLDEAVSLLRELAPERGYLIHISHQLGLHNEVEKELPDFIKIAYDGLKITVGS